MEGTEVLAAAAERGRSARPIATGRPDHGPGRCRGRKAVTLCPGLADLDLQVEMRGPGFIIRGCLRV